ncbi:MAG: hypothetical protein ACLP8B_17950 [Xanthobacteraceae bacterium]|jgi:hypothetical protein
MGTRVDQALTWGQRFSAAWSILTGTFFKVYIWPVGSAVLTAVAGYMGSVPVMWIMMAVAIVFACVAQSWLRISEILERMNPRNKLAYVQTVVHFDLKGGPALANVGGSTGRPRKLEQVQIGVELQNRSPSPMSLFVANAETEIDGLFPPRTNYPKAPVTILPGALVRCLDLPIPMNDKPCGRMTAKMSIKVKYGMQGDEDEELNFDAVLDILIQPDATQIQVFTNWNPNAILHGATAIA